MVSEESKPIHKIHADTSEHPHHAAKKKRGMLWMLVSIVLGMLLVASIFTNGFKFDNYKVAQDSISDLLSKESDANIKASLSDSLDSLKAAKTLYDESKKTASVKTPYNGKKVKLDFYVMSQCPYGTQVEDAVKPALDKLGDAVDFSLNFISTDNGDGTFKSLHGEPETKGNIVQLCAIKYNPDKFMDMVVCMNKDARSIPGNWEACSNSNGLDSAKIKACYEGSEGKTLLSESIKKSNAVQASGSPTMFLNGEPYVKGRDTLSFTRALCSKLDNNPECAKMPACGSDSDCTSEADKVGKCTNPNAQNAKCEYSAPATVNMIVINDKRCADCQQANQLIGQLKTIFKGLKTTQYDYSDAEGKKLVESLKIKYLPVFLFDESVKQGEGYSRVERYFDSVDKYYSLKIGSSFDPTAEICDNKVDDNADGNADCLDLTCKENIVCREEKAKKLDLFVMSQCPYGILAMNAMKEILPTLGSNVDFEIHFIANDNGDGTFTSLHGQPEVDENIRESCVMKYYPKPDDFMKYIWCRNANMKTDWQKCASDSSMDASKIKACSEGSEGKDLLRQKIKLSNDLQIGASPTWMANNKYQFSAIDAETAKSSFCQYNKVSGCEKTLSGNTQGAQASGAACGG